MPVFSVYMARVQDVHKFLRVSKEYQPMNFETRFLNNCYPIDPDHENKNNFQSFSEGNTTITSYPFLIKDIVCVLPLSSSADTWQS